MEIKTRLFGEVEIDEEMILEFPWGVLGFPESKHFVLLEDPELPGFQFLQDIHNSHVSFTVVAPWDFYEEYEVNISDEDLLSIRCHVPENSVLEVYAIVTVGKDLEDSTVNLMAPVVINAKEKIGKQFVLHDTAYETRHPLISSKEGR